ncbi:MAG: septal ring lytic transglycosylase RlpA family protein [Spirochaetia bacterium]|jgi:rare lipoprotein A|nr:septal ring lytic transglycosylase RlpA family protein [Spirochaetia bacterium]
MNKQLTYFIILLIIVTTHIFSLEKGEASWYGGKFQGRQTANGENFDTNMLTAAHKTLPFNTIVEVKNLENEKTVHVRINDRGPFIEGRIIDLSRAAASKLDMVGTGVAKVEVRIIEDSSDLIDNPDHNSETGLMQHNWIVQVASFSNNENAEKVERILNDNDFITHRELTSNGYIRILLKDISNSEIEVVEGRLKDLGFPTILLRKP